MRVMITGLSFGANPFISSYVESDGFGKLIFLGLFLLSTSTWILIFQKGWQLVRAKREARAFRAQFTEGDPLHLQFAKQTEHPLFSLYKRYKKQTLILLVKRTRLSPEDLKLLEAELKEAKEGEVKSLERHLYFLSTIFTLAPFLGLLGTVWGILLTFSQMNAKGFAMSNTAMLSGLSMALATTVIGLVIAIPALIGYNVLRSMTKELGRDMEAFSRELLTQTEIHQKE